MRLVFVMKRVVVSSETVENIGFGFDTDRTQFLCREIWPPLPRPINKNFCPILTIAGDRTWFYLLRSSAITIAGSQTIAEVCFHMIADDRRPYCDLRSYGNQPLFLSSAIVCDHDRRIADDRRSVFPYDRRRSQTIADLIAICDLRSAIIWKPAFIAGYDAILDQSDQQNLYNHLSNYTKYI